MKYKSEVIGKNGIVAKVVAKSKSAYSGQEIVTWEVEHHRWLLAEINKHRMFSNNYQSSRAVPVAKIIEQVRNNPATPIFWGKNQAGMQAVEEVDNCVDFNDYHAGEWQNELDRDDAWKVSAESSAMIASAWSEAGYHKQIVNRLLEPFMMVKGVITATEIDNFFHLRYHKDAQPELQELARCMWEAYEQADAEVLYEGEWHTPYVSHVRDTSGNLMYLKEELEPKDDGKTYTLSTVTVEQAKQTSAAACAQVSFRKLDTSEETVERVVDRLLNGDIPHSVPFEHQVTPMKQFEYPWGSGLNAIDCFSGGITHMDTLGNMWSGNFKHWIQNRKLIPNEKCDRFKLREG